MDINCKGKLISLEEPRVMGILNVTPDSFFDGGLYQNEKAIISQAKTLIEEGADFIDIGGYSSRPGAADVTEKEELRRVLPVVEMLTHEFPETPLSIDTFRSNVAGACLEKGAAIINDIYAGSKDPDMFSVVKKANAPYIMMHMQGEPKTMQLQPVYQNVITDILYFFSERLAEARAAGINDIVIDPGFGFGKTLSNNYEILAKLAAFHIVEVPLLIGVSRKSMIHKFLGISAEEALNGTSVLHTLALQQGAHILRVHDVKEAKECVKLVSHFQKQLQ